MPFTLAHPAAAIAVWPLVRRGTLPLAAFVVGTMAPDAEYLIRLEPFALLSHSALGVVLICLPAGAAMLLLWRALVRSAVRALLALPQDGVPVGVRGGWPGDLVALLLGSASHVGWDAFTHRDAWGPALVPSLRETALTVAGMPLPWYDVLQLASSVLGAGVVAWWLRHELRRQGVGWPSLVVPWRLRAWLALGAMVLVLAAWNAPRQGLMTGIDPVTLMLGRSAVGGLVGLAVGLVVLGMLHRVGALQLEPRPGRGHA